MGGGSKKFLPAAETEPNLGFVDSLIGGGTSSGGVGCGEVSVLLGGVLKGETLSSGDWVDTSGAKEVPFEVLATMAGFVGTLGLPALLTGGGPPGGCGDLGAGGCSGEKTVVLVGSREASELVKGGEKGDSLVVSFAGVFTFCCAGRSCFGGLARADDGAEGVGERAWKGEGRVERGAWGRCIVGAFAGECGLSTVTRGGDCCGENGPIDEGRGFGDANAGDRRAIGVRGAATPSARSGLGRSSD